MRDLLKQSIINSALNSVRFTYDSDGEQPSPSPTHKKVKPPPSDDGPRKMAVDLNSIMSNNTSLNSTSLSALMEQGYGSDDNTSRKFSSPAKSDSYTTDESPQKNMRSPLRKREDALGMSGYMSQEEESPQKRNQTMESDRVSVVDSKYDSESEIGSEIDFGRLSKRTKNMAAMGDQEFDEAVDRLSNILQQAAQIDEQKASSKVLDQIEKDKLSDLRQVFLTQKVHEDADSLWREVGSRVQRSLKSFSVKGLHEDDGERRAIAVSIMNNINDAMLSEHHPNLHAIHHPNKAGQLTGRKVLTKGEWNSIVDRLCRPYERREKKIEEIKQQREEEEANYSFRPHINKKSREITSTMLNLEDRLSTFLSEREQNLQKLREQVSNQGTEELTFQPQLTRASRSMARDVDQLFTWNEEKKQKIAKIRQEKQESETNGCSFKPELSNRSRKIMDKKKPRDVYMRNYEYEYEKMQRRNEKIRKIENEQKNHPSITYKASVLPRDEPVGDRLYRMAMTSIKKKKRKIRQATSGNITSFNTSGVVDYDSDEDNIYFGDQEESEYKVHERVEETPKSETLQNLTESSPPVPPLSKPHTETFKPPTRYDQVESDEEEDALFQYVDRSPSPSVLSDLANMVQTSPVNTKYHKTLSTLQRFHEFRKHSTPPPPSIVIPSNLKRKANSPQKQAWTPSSPRESPVHVPASSSPIRPFTISSPFSTSNQDIYESNDEDLVTLRVMNTSLEAIKQIYKTYNRKREKSPSKDIEVFNM